ncbi:MAG: cytochrome c biogenesis protein CcsA [Candidatus Hydrogenedentes bacterium]|nr:cytochrome c biogenesis protein CcsA [Candidatus Hydrogenedentota bacterium]
MMRWNAPVVALVAAVWAAFAAMPARAGAAPPITWDEEVVELFSTLPIQSEGRIKPLSTYAAFKLLKLNGRRTYRDPEGWKRDSMEWLLDCLFFPEAARDYPVFLIENYDTADAIGVARDGKKKRDRYSYAELLPGRDRLLSLGEQYSGVPAKERTYTQSQLVNLASNLREFEQILLYLDFARCSYPVESPVLPGPIENRLSAVLERAPVLRVALAVLDHGMESLGQLLGEEEARRMRAALPEGIAEPDEATRAAGREAIRALLDEVDEMGLRAAGLALFPPSAPRDVAAEWLAPGDMVSLAFFSDRPIDGELALLRDLEDLAAARDDEARFTECLRRFHGGVAGRARSRGEYDTIRTEVTFYKAKFFHRSLVLFLACFLFVAIMWMRPGSRALARLAPVALLAPTGLLLAGIVFRCVIRGRPPVTTLYETILFATLVAVSVSLFIEFMNRRKTAVSVAVVLGVAGLFLANKYEVREGVDTMPSMVAVLDTNFWLSTHVTTIIMGYAAGLLAAALGHVYILGRAAGFKRGDEGFYDAVARMVYGVTCFGFLFATMGTVLGGIWAAQSWGRFWGWDPKENGALMIVLWQAAVLHARKGGYIRDLGLGASAVFGGMVIVFSWWGINLLGVGLHSYGFTSGILHSLLAFYAIETVVLLAAGAVGLRMKRCDAGVANSARS